MMAILGTVRGNDFYSLRIVGAVAAAVWFFPGEPLGGSQARSCRPLVMIERALLSGKQLLFGDSPR